MTDSCYDQAHEDYYMLHQECTCAVQPNLLGGRVTKIYRDSKTPHVMIGIVIEDEDGVQHLVVPITPSPDPNDRGWMCTYKCHIPIPFKGIKDVYNPEDDKA